MQVENKIKKNFDILCRYTIFYTESAIQNILYINLIGKSNYDYYRCYNISFLYEILLIHFQNGFVFLLKLCKSKKFPKINTLIIFCEKNVIFDTFSQF